jgi:hypothetical protein
VNQFRIFNINSYIVVYVDTPETAPVVSANPNKRSIRLSWTPLNPTDDVGRITWYTIEFNNQSSIITHSVKYSSSTFNLTYLKPYTNYTVRMNAKSFVGTGPWSTLKHITTYIAGKM